MKIKKKYLQKKKPRKSKYRFFELMLEKSHIPFIPEYYVKDLFSDDSGFKKQYRMDYLFFNQKTLEIAFILEIEGGIFSYGRHTRGTGFWNDILKYNAITLAGVPLLRLPAALLKKRLNLVVDFLLDIYNGELKPIDLYNFIIETEIK